MVGATGPNPGLVLPELNKRDVTVRARVRDEQRASSARANGAAETTIGVVQAILGREPRPPRDYFRELTVSHPSGTTVSP
jgi:hypothetical protein